MFISLWNKASQQQQGVISTRISVLSLTLIISVKTLLNLKIKDSFENLTSRKKIEGDT